MLKKIIVFILFYLVFGQNADQQYTISTPYFSNSHGQALTSYFDNNSKPVKIIPPTYNPSDVSFNPSYYGLLQTNGLSQTSPVPQPNYYNIQSDSSSSPWSVVKYQFTSPQQNDYNPTANPDANQSSSEGSNIEAYGKVTRPEFSTNYNNPRPVESTGNDLLTRLQELSNRRKLLLGEPNGLKGRRQKIQEEESFSTADDAVESVSYPNQSSAQYTVADSTQQKLTGIKLPVEARKILANLLEFSNRHKGLQKTFSEWLQKKKPNDDHLSGADDGVYVSYPDRSKTSNIYSLPKIVYGNKNEPVTAYNPLKILTGEQ